MTTAIVTGTGKAADKTVEISWVERSQHRRRVRVAAAFDPDCEGLDLENGLAELHDDGFEGLERSVVDVHEVEDDPDAEFFDPSRCGVEVARGGFDAEVIPGEVWTRFLAQESQLDWEHPGEVTLSAVVGEIRRLMAEE